MVVCAVMCVSSREHMQFSTPPATWCQVTHEWFQLGWGWKLTFHTMILLFSTGLVAPGRLEGHILIFLIKSLFLLTFGKKTSSEPDSDNLYVYSWLKWWPSAETSARADAQREGIKTGRTAVESPLWLWSWIKATGLLWHWQLYSSGPVGNTPD